MIKPINKHILANGIIQYVFQNKRVVPVETIEDEATEFCRAVKKQYKKLNLSGVAYFCYYYIEIGKWMPSYGVDLGDQIHAYNPADEYQRGFTGQTCKGIKNFDIYIRPFKQHGGIDNIHNDCFFDCLYRAVGKNSIYLPVNMRTRSHMKKTLGLDRDDCIGLNEIKQIDKLLKHHKINVCGDIKYTSKKDVNLIIKLRLYNEHYTLLGDTNRKQHATYGYDSAIVFTFKMNYTERTVNIYDGQNEKCISFTEFNKMRKQSKQYKFLQTSKIIPNIKAAYNLRKEQRDSLFNESNGKIDLYRYQSFGQCVLDTFRNYSKSLQEPEPISHEECVFLSNAFMGGIIYAKEYTGQIYGYDANSMYPSKLSEFQFNFPIKPGQCITMTDAEFNSLEYYKYGIYRCVIDCRDDVKMLFRFNIKNYYTHHDLSRAKSLKLKISLICDKQPNVLLYKKSDLVNGASVFAPYVNLLYLLKKNGCKPAKEMLNLLWGLLCQKNTTSKVLSREDNPIIDEHFEILSIVPEGNHESKLNRFEYQNNDILFKTNYARLGPFLTAYCRTSISRIIEPFKSHIKRIHTDGFYLTKELTEEDIKIGTELGQFKRDTKKTGNCIIKNVMQMTMLE